MALPKLCTAIALGFLLELLSSYQVRSTPARIRDRFQDSDPDHMCFEDISSIEIESASTRNWDDHSGLEGCGYTHIGYFGSCSNYKAQIEQKVAIPSTSGSTENRIDKGLGDGRLYLFDSAWAAADHAVGVCEKEKELLSQQGPSVAEDGQSSTSVSVAVQPMVCIMYMPTIQLKQLQKLYLPMHGSDDEIEAFEESSAFTTSQTVRFGNIRNLPAKVFPSILYSAWPENAVDHMITLCRLITEDDALGMSDPQLLPATAGYYQILTTNGRNF